MALDTPYGAAGRLRKFNSYISLLFPPPLQSKYQPPLYFVPAVFLRVFPTGFPRFSRYRMFPHLWAPTVNMQCSRQCPLPYVV